MVHYTEQYLLNPPHAITVDVVGMGGTGSQVITGLARINEALRAQGHPGLHVRAWDPDTVGEANIGRQLFSVADLGLNKAIVLITRINRYFGYEWEAVTEKYSGKKTSNILITCVDTAAVRVKIAEQFSSQWNVTAPTDKPYYWLDMGNLHKTGQCVLGTIQKIKQPKVDKVKATAVLKNVVEKLPQIKKVKEKDQGPSCSLVEAIGRQDLFINSTLAQFGCNMIWKLFREGVIRYHGCYVNLETFSVNPIRI